MRRFVLLFVLVFFSASAAFGADTNKYPTTLIDGTCTDDYDTPAHSSPPPVVLGGFIVSPSPQTTGSADGYCDNDSYIVAGAIAADLVVGPFSLPIGAKGLIWLIDVDAISGGGTDANFSISVLKPHTAETSNLWISGTVSSTGDLKYIVMMDSGAYAYSGSSEEASISLPHDFKLKFNLLTATSMTSPSSLVVIY